jgi:hypothetical protein
MNNCKVGSSVVVEGYPSLGKLELPDGSLRNMHEVVTENVLLLQVSGDERIGVFNNHADFEDDDFFDFKEKDLNLDALLSGKFSTKTHHKAPIGECVHF